MLGAPVVKMVRSQGIKNGFAKVQIGLAKGKKRFDKRESIKDKDTKRDMDRALKSGKVRI